MKAVVGRTVDRKYAVDRLLGRGGMGAVYAATHLGTGRVVALKIIMPRLMTDADSLERFRREAQAAGRLRHPNVVNVTDFGVWEGDLGTIPYLVMEYLDGLSLRELLRTEGPLPVRAVVEIIEQVSVAVQKAHESGIVHRDLKPDNIWLEPNDLGGYTVKVLDFGLARIALGDPRPTLQQTREVEPVVDRDTTTELRVDAAGESPDEITAIIPHNDPAAEPTMVQLSAGPAPDLTRAGMIMGTPYYMSPEQCRGEVPGPSSDIYSLGVIAYEMLHGRRPFEGSTAEIVRKHVEEPPPEPGRGAKRVPKRVGEALGAALAKSPEDRPASARAFAAMLRARAEGAGAILRRALTVSSEHAGPFLIISLLAFLPLIAARILGLLEGSGGWLYDFYGWSEILMAPAIFAVLVGVITPMVAQIILRPYAPISVEGAFRILLRQAPAFIWASVLFFVRVVVLVLMITLLFQVISRVVDVAEEPGSSAHQEASVQNSEIGSKDSSAEVGYVIGSWVGRTFKDNPALAIVGVVLPAIILVVVLLFALVMTPRRIAERLLYGPALMMEGLTARMAFRRSRELYGSVAGSVRLLIVVTLVWWGMSGGLNYLVAFRFRESPARMTEVFLIELMFQLVNIGSALIIAPVLVTAIALLYFQARASNGETLDEIIARWTASTDSVTRSRVTLAPRRYGSGFGTRL